MNNNAEIGYYINLHKYQLATKLCELIHDNNKRHFFDTREETFELALQDLTKLFIAVISERPSIFSNYIEWKKSVYLNRKMPYIELKNHLDYLDFLNTNFLPIEYRFIISEYIEQAKIKMSKRLKRGTYIDNSNQCHDLVKNYLNYVLQGKKHEAEMLVEEEINSGTPLKSIYNDLLYPAQLEIGRLWELNIISVADEHYATEIATGILNHLNQKMEFIRQNGKKAITVSIDNETHIMGIRFVNDLLKLSGWKTYFLGIGAPNSEIIKFANKYTPDVIAISTTMDVHLLKVKNLIEEIKDQSKSKVIVGGNIFNEDQSLVESIGADFYAPTAEEGIELLNREFVGEKEHDS